MPGTHGTPYERAMRSVTVDDDTGCWLSSLCQDSGGYCTIQIDGEKVRLHRFMWVHNFGPILPEQYVLHRCDTPNCVNPMHLFLGDAKDNADDAASKGRATHQKPGKSGFATRARRKPITCLAQWYGSNRSGASKVGYLLRDCKVVNIPFAGGLSEVWAISENVRQINCNDLHRHIINLARCVAHPEHCRALVNDLRKELVHPDTLAGAQEWCKAHPERPWKDTPDLAAAKAYFTTVWLSRSSSAGTGKEFSNQLVARFTPGGDPAIRWASAIKMLSHAASKFLRCTFLCEDYKTFLGRCYDDCDSGLYLDCPFPDLGDDYLHNFKQQDHVDLENILRGYKLAPVVVRYYAHPLIDSLYTAERGWTRFELYGRNQANDAAPELLLVRNIPGVS